MEPEPMPQDGASPSSNPRRRFARALPYLAVVLAAIAGLALMADSIRRTSATYDEVAYLRVAAHWWRTGDQDRITRMGSPLTFWKLQQGPVFWAIDRSGLGSMLDDPERNQRTLLPIVRVGSLWIWLIALLATADWARRAHGLRSMALAAWLFALSPNLLAHGTLVTMETPLVACSALTFGLFATFLRTGSRRTFVASAIVCGLAFSCKFTAIAFPPILMLGYGVNAISQGGIRSRFLELKTWAVTALRAVALTLIFVAMMIASNLVVTGFALATPSEHRGDHPSLSGRYGEALLDRIAETPMPRDWVGFVIQLRHQQSGGPSYLLGETRSKGWWYYYLVALAVKVPLAISGLIAARLAMRRRSTVDDRLILTAILAFLTMTALGSTRNYGVRYLLPLAPMAIVWISALADGNRRFRSIGLLGLAALVLGVASIHPHELSYFNALVGGPSTGRRVLADSNLDWGQGLRSLADLQRNQPLYRDLTLYYFGDTRPEYYAVSGTHHVINADRDHPGLPPILVARTPYLAVSTSLLHGPWSPPGYFRILDGEEPVETLADGTISIYRVVDLNRRRGLSTGDLPDRRPPRRSGE